MLHLLYIFAFSTIAFIAIGNLIRNLITLGSDSQRHYAPRTGAQRSRPTVVPHPELLDNTGNPVNEPLLVMRSVTVEDAREQLDALYHASPGNPLEDEL